MFYAMAHNNAFYEDRVNVFTSLAPCTRMKFTKNPIFSKLAHFYKDMKELSSKYHVADINDKNFFERATTLCHTQKDKKSFGYWLCQFKDRTCGDVETPLRSMLHYMQSFIKKEFVEYDPNAKSYKDIDKNKKFQKVPMQNIKKGTFALFTGEHDDVCAYADTKWVKVALEHNKKNFNDVLHIEEVKGKDHAMTDGNLAYFKKVT